MASLLDSIQSSVGVVLGGATKAAQQAATDAAAKTSDSVSAYIGTHVNKGVSVVDSINAKPASTASKPTVVSAIPDAAGNSKNMILLAIAGALALFLVLKK